jgi:hypothetical protein
MYLHLLVAGWGVLGSVELEELVMAVRVADSQLVLGKSATLKRYSSLRQLVVASWVVLVCLDTLSAPEPVPN